MLRLKTTGIAMVFFENRSCNRCQERETLLTLFSIFSIMEGKLFYNLVKTGAVTLLLRVIIFQKKGV